MRMTTDAKTVLEWTYTPKSLFESPCHFTFAGGQITIADGTIRGEFDDSCYGRGLEFRDEVHAHVETVFMAQQVQVCENFTLSAASMVREHADGHRDVTGFLEPFHLKMSAGRADFILRNANGEIIQDTKVERLQKQQDFRDRVATLTSSSLVLKRMLQSFRNALIDDDNLLIHLYEVREALTSEYGGDIKVRKALSVSSVDWSRFGQLANNEPIQEGRHRGKHTGLRLATKAETEWALSFAQRLIEEYVTVKMNNSSTKK